jgi:N utilization substance protein B
MLNRRHIRIKILHILYGFYQDEDLDSVKAQKALDHSIAKMNELYLLLLNMVSGMQEIAIDRIETARKKQLPTPEDLHPNTKFVRNAPLRVLANSKNLRSESERLSVGWSNNLELLRNMFRDLVGHEEYTEYMASEERGFKHDRESLLRMFRKNLINQEVFQEMLEEESIFWLDDLDLASSMVIKTIKSINEEDDDVEVLKLWREDDDDKDFMEGLFTQTLAQGKVNEEQRPSLLYL